MVEQFLSGPRPGLNQAQSAARPSIWTTDRKHGLMEAIRCYIKRSPSDGTPERHRRTSLLPVQAVFKKLPLA